MIFLPYTYPQDLQEYEQSAPQPAFLIAGATGVVIFGLIGIKPPIFFLSGDKKKNKLNKLFMF